MITALLVVTVTLLAAVLVALDQIARQAVTISDLERQLGSNRREAKMERLRRPAIGHPTPLERPAPPTTGEMRVLFFAEVDEPPRHCDGRVAVVTPDGRLQRPAPSTARRRAVQRASL